MNRNVSAQISYDRLNKGVDVRESSTANFLIDSQDRESYNESLQAIPGVALPASSSADFLINKSSQSLVTGFFTRFAMTEIELAYNMPNVSSLYLDGRTFITAPVPAGTVNYGNNVVSVVVALAGVLNFFPDVTIPSGNYTVAEALDRLVVALNLATNALFPNLFALFDSTSYRGKKALGTTNAAYTFGLYRNAVQPFPGIIGGPTFLNLGQALGLFTFDTFPAAAQCVQFNIAANPNLLLFNYLDFCSSQLASQQKLKDATTSTFDSNDVIYRWVFANDESQPVTYDTYGYPIIQGYRPFNSRRFIQFPKQIRWDPLIPLGQIRIQIYTDKNVLLKYRPLLNSVEFKMLMLISEV
jgi:hypothetical protein